MLASTFVFAMLLLGIELISPSEGLSFNGHWGTWRNKQSCPQGQVAIGFRLRTEDNQDDGDDTALNSVVLYCGSPSNRQRRAIESYEGIWGTWGKVFVCPGSSVITGMRVSWEDKQDDGDDTAMNNVAFVCSNGNVLTGDGQGWGSWRGWSRCGSGHAIHTIQIRYESDQGHDGDDTAMNGIRADCKSY